MRPPRRRLAWRWAWRAVRWHCCSWRGRCWPASGGESSQALPLLHPPTRRWLRSLVPAPLLLAAALSGSTTEEQSPASREIRRDSLRRARVTTKSDWSTRAETSREEPSLAEMSRCCWPREGCSERASGLFSSHRPRARAVSRQAAMLRLPRHLRRTARGQAGRLPVLRHRQPGVSVRLAVERVWSGKRAFGRQLNNRVSLPVFAASFSR